MNDLERNNNMSLYKGVGICISALLLPVVVDIRTFFDIMVCAKGNT